MGAVGGAGVAPPPPQPQPATPPGFAEGAATAEGPARPPLRAGAPASPPFRLRAWSVHTHRPPGYPPGRPQSVSPRTRSPTPLALSPVKAPGLPNSPHTLRPSAVLVTPPLPHSPHRVTGRPPPRRDQSAARPLTAPSGSPAPPDAEGPTSNSPPPPVADQGGPPAPDPGGAGGEYDGRLTSAPPPPTRAPPPPQHSRPAALPRPPSPPPEALALAREVSAVCCINAAARQRLSDLRAELAQGTAEAAVRRHEGEERLRQQRKALARAAAEVAGAEGRCAGLLAAVRESLTAVDAAAGGGEAENARVAALRAREEVMRAAAELLQGRRTQQLLEVKEEEAARLRAEVGSFNTAELAAEGSHGQRLAAIEDLTLEAATHVRQLQCAVGALESVIENTCTPLPHMRRQAENAALAAQEARGVIEILEREAEEIQRQMDVREEQATQQRRGLCAVHGSGDVRVVVEMVQHDRRRHERERDQYRATHRALEQDLRELRSRAEAAAGKQLAAEAARDALREDEAAILSQLTELQRAGLSESSELRAQLARYQGMLQQHADKHGGQGATSRRTSAPDFPPLTRGGSGRRTGVGGLPRAPVSVRRSVPTDTTVNRANALLRKATRKHNEIKAAELQTAMVAPDSPPPEPAAAPPAPHPADSGLSGACGRANPEGTFSADSSPVLPPRELTDPAAPASAEVDATMDGLEVSVLSAEAREAARLLDSVASAAEQAALLQTHGSLSAASV
eukprot:TRINITY_DN9004_c4_g1_i2.p1 TRINITY_DN9004_c4_g1~~TRINITY_DN9004_c4_g1_i2.p1  ORF type:complete len:763 (+),score=215.29 TRINITY_DN9004_c4_g1_i2:70-2289(+)